MKKRCAFACLNIKSGIGRNVWRTVRYNKQAKHTTQPQIQTETHNQRESLSIAVEIRLFDIAWPSRLIARTLFESVEPRPCSFLVLIPSILHSYDYFIYFYSTLKRYAMWNGQWFVFFFLYCSTNICIFSCFFCFKDKIFLYLDANHIICNKICAPFWWNSTQTIFNDVQKICIDEQSRSSSSSKFLCPSQ